MSQQVKTFFPAKVKVGTKETDWVCEMIQCPGDCGEYVLESDYAALAAENERLRKAGDAMHRAIKVSDYALDWAIEVWLAAKEGRDAK